ncbi:MAG: WD40 repeat domain-containing protein, partial [bacterium]
MAFSPNGRRIASSSGDNTLRLWDGASGKALGAPLQGHTAQVNAVVFSPDGERLASAAADKKVRLWSVRTGQPIGLPLQGHSS